MTIPTPVCARCDGRGYVATKNGSKPCPFCNPGRVPQRPAVDWGYIAIGIGVYAVLIAVAIVGGM